MASTGLSLLHIIRMMAGAYKQDRRTDAELLSHYANTKDQTAFAALMVRHGPMVFDLCRSVLHNETDAEDAYQIAFLALARQAQKIRVNDTLAGWLYQVARRSSLDARKARKAQHNLQKNLKTQGCPEAASEPEPVQEDESNAILYEELANLPEKQRVVLVLSCMEGKTLVEIAGLLGVKEPAVCTRLARAKARLQERLTKRGFVLGAAALAALLETRFSHAVPPHRLIVQTMKTATAFCDGKLTGGLAQLAKEVLKQAPANAPWWKSGWMIVVACVGGLGLGAGGVAWRASFFGTNADGPTVVKKQEESQEKKNPRSKQPRLDAYGDPLPAGALARLGTVRFRRDGSDVELVKSVGIVVTADKKLIIPADYRNPARLCRSCRCFDLRTGKPLQEIEDDQKRTIKLDRYDFISQDCRLLGRRDASNTKVAFWNLSSGLPLNNGAGDKLLGSEGESLIVLSRDGNRVASTVHSKEDLSFSVWDNGSPKARWSQSYKNYRALQLMFSSDDKVLMALCDHEKEYLVKRWEIATGKELPSRALPRQWLGCPFVWSNDGETIAVCPQFRGNAVCIWNMTTGKKVQEIHCTGRDYTIGGLAVSSDGKVLAALAANVGGVFFEFWDLTTGKFMRRSKSAIREDGAMAFSPDGEWLVAVPPRWGNHRSIAVWDVASGEQVNQIWYERGHHDVVESLVFSPRGEELTSIGQSGGLIQWSAVSGSDAFQISRTMACYEKPFLGHSGIGVVGRTPGGSAVAYGDISGRIRVWNAETGRLVSTISTPHSLSSFLAFCPSKKMIAFTKGFQNFVGVHLYDLASAKCDEPVEGSTCAFSPDGKWLAVGGRKEGFCLWDCIHHKEAAHAGGRLVQGIAYSPDGRTLAVSTRLETNQSAVYSWNVREEGTGARLEGPRTLFVGKPTSGEEMLSLVFSPDGKRLAAARRPAQGDSHYCTDVVIPVWETATGKERRRFNEGGSFATTLAFAPDGRRLASGHKDSTILIWDATGELKAGKLSPRRFSDQDLAALWADLAGGDAGRADQAIWSFAAAGPRAVHFFKTRLGLARRSNVTEDVLSQLIAGLDAKEFAVRRKAMQELERLGPDAEVKLREALQKRPSLELRHSAHLLLKRIEQERMASRIPSEDLRALRAIEVLEQIENKEVCRMLEKLASGDPSARLTEEARSGLNYWKTLHQSK